MISIQILEPTHLNNPRDAFVVTCVAMIGDGDEFHEVRLAPIHRTPGYEDQIEELVELLTAMDQFQWVDGNDYSDLPNFGKWFRGEDHDDNGEIGGNPFTDDGQFLDTAFIATLHSYKIAYYDNEGIEHRVSITQ